MIEPSEMFLTHSSLRSKHIAEAREMFLTHSYPWSKRIIHYDDTLLSSLIAYMGHRCYFNFSSLAEGLPYHVRTLPTQIILIRLFNHTQAYHLRQPRYHVTHANTSPLSVMQACKA